MAELSVAHRAVLAQMLERVPDKTLKALSVAVAQMPGDKARALSQMLAEETADRRRRAVAFAPLIPMFRARADGVEALTFPSGVLPRLWKAASSREPSLLPMLDDVRGVEDDPRVVAVSDRICVAASAVIRDQPDVIWPADGSDPETREEGLTELARCFDLAALARRGVFGLPALILRPTEGQLAELRLLVRDSGEMTPDGGPRMLEILFSHLGDASLILRLVVQSSRAAAKEGVLSESEMAGFVNRLIAAVEARVARIATFKQGDAGRPRADLQADISWCAETLAELDATLQLDPVGAWGRQAREARARINRTLSVVLSSTNKALDKVMPTRRVPIVGRMTREAPALDQSVPESAVEAAAGLLTLVGTLRTAAQIFGCESQRYKLVQSVTERITAYVDETIESVNAGEVEDEGAALALVERLARLLLLIDANDAARTVRRRAGAAGTLAAPAATTATIQPSHRAA
jgi:hypothetical protein